MPNRYRWLLGITALLGTVALVWGCFVWAPDYGSVRAPESIIKLNVIEKMGLPGSSVLNEHGDRSEMGEVLRQMPQAKLVAVHFWASWCGPCIEELPALIEFASRNEELAVVAVAEDSDSRDAVKFYSKIPRRSKNFTMVFDPSSETAQKFGTEKLPETFVFCPDGKFVHKFGTSVAWAKVDSVTFLKACPPAAEVK